MKPSRGHPHKFFTYSRKETEEQSEKTSLSPFKPEAFLDLSDNNHNKSLLGEFIIPIHLDFREHYDSANTLLEKGIFQEKLPNLSSNIDDKLPSWQKALKSAFKSPRWFLKSIQEFL